MQNNNIKIIYIAGYGRSGSTLLDIILGVNSSIFSMGEVASIFSEIQNDHFCSCGDKIKECQVWKTVLNISDEASLKELKYKDKVTRNFGGIKKLISLHMKKDHDEIWSSIFTSLREVTGCNILVDSSKVNRFTLYRILSLKEMGYNVSLVHLVKHPYAVMESIAKGNNKAIQYSNPKLKRIGGIYRSTLGWLLSNWATEKFCYPIVNSKIRVRYEDLVSSPDRTLIEISNVCNINVSQALSSIQHKETLEVGHGIAGNRMRSTDNTKGVQLITKSIKEVKPSYHPNFILHRLVKNMALRYGYNI